MLWCVWCVRCACCVCCCSVIDSCFVISFYFSLSQVQLSPASWWVCLFRMHQLSILTVTSLGIPHFVIIYCPSPRLCHVSYLRVVKFKVNKLFNLCLSLMYRNSVYIGTKQLATFPRNYLGQTCKTMTSGRKQKTARCLLSTRRCRDVTNLLRYQVLQYIYF